MMLRIFTEFGFGKVSVTPDSLSTMTRTRKSVLLFLAAGAVVGLYLFFSPRKPPLNITQTLADATALVEQNRLVEAEACLRDVLEASPEHPEATVTLGQLLWLRNDKAAFDVWKRVADDVPDFGAVARYLEGGAFYDRGLLPQAEKSLLYAAELRPGYEPPLLLLLEAYSLQRRAEDIRAILSRLSAVRELTTTEMCIDLLAGNSLAPAQMVSEKLKLLENDEQERCRAVFVNAANLRDEGKLDEALQFLDSVTEHNVDSAALYVAILIETGDQRTAATMLKSAKGRWEQWSGNSAYSVAVANFLRTGRRFESASILLKHALAQNPLNAAAHLSLGRCLEELGDTDGSRKCFSRAILVDEVERDAFLLLRGNPDVALVANTVIDISDRLFDLGDQTRAQRWLRRAQQLIPDLTSNRASHPVAQMLKASASPWTPQVREDLAQAIRLVEQSEAIVNADALGVTVISFKDVAVEQHLDFTYENGGAGHHLIFESIGGGVGVIDFDNDGLPDLFFPQGAKLSIGNSGPEPNVTTHDRLFRNTGRDGFVDVSAIAGITDSSYSFGCAVTDLDNDGDDDIVVGTIGQNFWYENSGDGTFNHRPVGSQLDLTASIAAADFNADGITDLWCCNYVADWQATCQTPAGDFKTCLPATFPAAQDVLLTGIGDGQFVYTAVCPGKSVEAGRGLGVVALDLNDDNRIDVYVANDGSPNHLFVNESQGAVPEFTERAFETGCAVSDLARSEAGMGVSVADFNNDHRPDLFVTNFYMEPNRLYLQASDFFFEDASSRWNVNESTLPLLGFGTQASDFNGDGFPDLFVANGDIDDYSDTGRPWQMRPLMLTNCKGNKFTDTSTIAGDYFSGRYLGRGCATLDFDRDGGMDLAVCHQDRSVALLKNNSELPKSMTIQVVGTVSDRDAIGVRVTAESSAGTVTQWLAGGNGFMAANQKIFHFFCSGNQWDRVTVTWPAGNVSEVRKVSASSNLVFVEGRDRPMPLVD
jgi:tetratricopeptide (TPR) repeat protein